MATSKLQALWNHPAGPKTSQFFSAKKLFFSFAELYVPSLSIQNFFRSDRIRSATKKLSPEIVFDSDLRALYIKQSNLTLLISFICVFFFYQFSIFYNYFDKYWIDFQPIIYFNPGIARIWWPKSTIWLVIKRDYFMFGLQPRNGFCLE